MDTTGFSHGKDIAVNYGIDTENQGNYGDMPYHPHILFHERNSELPLASKLKSNSSLLGIHYNKELSLLKRDSFIPKYNGEYITVGLDSLAIIFPFHTFF